MELDHAIAEGPGPKVKDVVEGSSRPKSPHKILYAAEIKVFRAQHGGLEDIRQKLGYSRRKMCRLLMVDPSAWTRWTKDEDRVPPHVYRALEWFLALNERIYTQPELGEIFMQRYRLPTFIQAASPQSSASFDVFPSQVEKRDTPKVDDFQRIEAESARSRELHQQLHDLQRRLDEQIQRTVGLMMGSLAVVVCLLSYIFIR